MALPAVARGCLPYPFYASRAELAALARALRSSHDKKQNLSVLGRVCMYLRVFARICAYLQVSARICMYFCMSLRLFACICAYLYTLARIVGNNIKMLQKITQQGSQNDPQNRPKTTPKSTPGGSQNGVWLCARFARFWGQFKQPPRGPNWSQK